MALTDSLISYWRLDEASGGATDAVGANHLTQVGTVGTAAGKIGTARDFPGAAGNSLRCASSADLSTADMDFTIAAWVRLDAKSGSPGIAGKDGAPWEYMLYLDSAADRFRLQVDAGGSYLGVNATTLGSPAVAAWYHVVCWHDSAANQIGIAVNGGAADVAAGGSGPGAGAADFSVGGLASVIGSVDGQVDEVGFWRRVLTAGERAQLYNGGAGLAYPFTPSNYRETILAEVGLVSYWRLDEPSGTVADDARGASNGTYTGVYTQDQAAAGSLQTKSTLFNGVSGCITVPSAAALHPTAAITLEAWVKLTALPGTSKAIAGCGHSTNTNPFVNYQFAVTAANKPAFFVGAAATLYQAVGALALAAGAWHHLVGTYDGSSVNLYVNGVLAASTALTGALNNSGQSFEVARFKRAASTGEYFNGNISDVALYDAALGAAAALAHYQAAGVPGAGRGVVVGSPVVGSLVVGRVA